MRWQALTAALLTAWTPCTAVQTALVWKLQRGDAFRVEHHVVQAMTLEAKNKPFAQKSVTKLETRWQVREVKNGRAAVSVTVLSMSSKSTTGDGKAEVASKDDALWQDAVFEISVDPQGRLHELRGYEELLKKLAAGDVSRLKILRALKPAETFADLLQDALGPLPEKPVSPGDAWRRKTAEAMNLFGTFEHATQFTYAGLKDGLHRIDGKTVTTFKNPRHAIENDVFRVLKGEVKADEAAGHFTFDAERGRTVRVQRQGTLRGELTLETLGMVQRVQFESRHELSIRVH